MAIGIIVGIILAILAVALCFGAYVCYENDLNFGRVTCLILAVLFAVSFVVVPFSFHTVNSGEVAVVRHLGKITGTREAGTNFDLWMTNTYQRYDIKVQNVDITTAAYSSDAQTMDVAMTLQYQIMPEKVVDIATQYGSLEVLQNRITSIVIEKTKATLSSHKAMNIIANRASISPEVEEAIKEAIDGEYFVNITAVVLTNIDFSDSFEKAVEDKMVAEQAKLKADYDNETKIAKAEADAKALKIAAEAEAEANNLLTKSLTDQVLESKFYDKWDGKLPQVMGEGTAITDIREDN
jgi:regulator of protease activity HflC (stomatin/prohibitin superfamily)